MDKEIKKIYEERKPDKEQIRFNVLSGVEAQTKTVKKFKLKPILAVCLAMFIFFVGFGGYATVEATEYRQAVEFFNEYNLSTEGYTRAEIKAVYKDITSKTYSYGKTIELLNSISVEMYKTELGEADKDTLEALWNTRNLHIFGNGEDKSGVYYQTEYNADTNGIEYTIIKYEGENELWRYTIPFDMYVDTDDNLFENDKGVVVYGLKRNSDNSSDYVAVAFMLGNSGELLWIHESTVPCSEFQAITIYGDEITLIGHSNINRLSQSYSGDDNNYDTVFTILDMNGKVITDRIFANDNFMRYQTIVRIEDSYLVRRNVRSDGFNFKTELVSISLTGELNEKFSYSQDDITYEIKDIIYYEGKVYLSALLPNMTDDKFSDKLGELCSEYADEWTKNQDVIMSDDYSERLNRLFKEQYAATLLVCDENAVITKAYSVTDARAGALEITSDGKLSWQVIRIDDVKNVPLYFSSKIMDIMATEFSFSFSEDGLLSEKREIGAHPMTY